MPDELNSPAESAGLPQAPTLTDPVMPVVTESPLPTPPVQPTPPTPPIIDTAPPLPPTPTKPVPAVLPPQKSSAIGAFFTTLLILLCLSTLAAATFFYFQNQTLITQINTIQSTLNQRQVDEVTPTPAAIPETTPTAVPTQKTATSSAVTGAFSVINDVISLAQTSAPQAQLLMITGENLQNAELATYKYWFRRAPATKSYLYVQVSPNKSPQLFSQATISPDNNIPDLIASFTKNEAGMDSSTALASIPNYGSPQTISAKYLKALPNNANFTAPILIWQFVFKYPPAQNKKDLVVQLEAVSGELLYTSSSTK